MFPDVSQLYVEESRASPEAAAPLSNVFVVSVGGSILVNGKPNLEAIAAFSNCINELVREGCRFVVTVGGGKVARDYIAAAKELGASHFVQDEIGIAVTRMNAALLTVTIETAHNKVLTDLNQSKMLLEQGKTPIYGGMLPGFTTDAVGALLAEGLRATFINLSNVDGIYDRDPRSHEDAYLFRELSHGKLLSIISNSVAKPGQNLVVDLVATMILKRSKILAFFLNGNDLENFKAAVRGQQFYGTIVKEIVSPGSEEAPAPEEKPKRTKRGKAAGKKKAAYVLDDDEEITPEDIEF